MLKYKVIEGVDVFISTPHLVLCATLLCMIEYNEEVKEEMADVLILIFA